MGKERLRVVDRELEVSLCDVFDGRSVDDAILELQALKSKVDESRGYDAKFKVEYSYDYTNLDLVIYRDETDAEYAARQVREERAREKARKARETKRAKALAQALQTEAEERALYEQLREKFAEKA